MRRLLIGATGCGALASAALAAPTLDGVRDAAYGAPKAVQIVQTHFGDANPNGGSELDAAYARIEGGTLYLMLTGNLENNFNKLNLFFDSQAGGQNILQNSASNGGDNPENDGWAGKHAGFTFDTGFEADYMLILRNGNFGGDRFEIDFATIGGGVGAFQAATNVFGGSLTGSNANALPNGIGVAHDRSNTGGVTGGTGAADQSAAAAVMTGIELSIPLSVIGSPVGAFTISAMINGSNHDYLSNQFLGGLTPPQGNLGGDGTGGFNGTVGQINLNNFAGEQFFVVPEPASLALLALAGVVLLRRRRNPHQWLAAGVLPPPHPGYRRANTSVSGPGSRRPRPPVSAANGRSTTGGRWARNWLARWEARSSSPTWWKTRRSRAAGVC